MKKEPVGIKDSVPAHVEYWKSKRIEQYQGGPYSDRGGGLIIFAASDLGKAIRIIKQDPFLKNDIIEQKWIERMAAGVMN